MTTPIIIIPARGGSKRIPHKNIKPFLGVPMIARAIETAKEALPYARIVVTTDDPKTAEIARAAGAEIPFLRPRDISDDMTGTAPVVAHALQTIGATKKEDICCMYATVPLLRAHTLSLGYEMLQNSSADYVFAATQYAFPPQRAFKQAPDGFITPAMPHYISSRSQDLEPWYHDSGQFYWGAAENWVAEKPVFSSKAVPLVLARKEVCDIDTVEDWEEAERLFLLARQQEKT